jgi:hypothetical protein
MAIPSNSTKESYANYQLSASIMEIIFAIDEAMHGCLAWLPVADCGGAPH